MLLFVFFRIRNNDDLKMNPSRQNYKHFLCFESEREDTFEYEFLF
jgi:hypothetical protein